MKKNVLHLVFGAALLFAGCSGDAPSYRMSDIVVSGDTPMTKEMAEREAYENELVEAALRFTVCVYEIDFANNQQADSVLTKMMNEYKKKYKIERHYTDEKGYVPYLYCILDDVHRLGIAMETDPNKFFRVRFGHTNKTLYPENKYYLKRAASKYLAKLAEMGYWREAYNYTRPTIFNNDKWRVKALNDFTVEAYKRK